MDNLAVPFHIFYNGQKTYRTDKNKPTLDNTGKQLLLNAHKRKQIKEALAGSSYWRRVYSNAYLNRSEDGTEMYLSDFEQLGPRWVQERHEIWRQRDGLLIGVVLCFTRHGAPDEHGEEQGNPKHKIYMAGTKHSEWDGVTLSMKTTDCMVTAARWADDMAEREAEKCREEDEAYQRQNRIDCLQDDIKTARHACLKLLRDMRPLRKGMSNFPESVCQALRDQVKNYCNDIAGWREEIRGMI